MDLTQTGIFCQLGGRASLVLLAEQIELLNKALYLMDFWDERQDNNLRGPKPAERWLEEYRWLKNANERFLQSLIGNRLLNSDDEIVSLLVEPLKDGRQLILEYERILVAIFHTHTSEETPSEDTVETKKQEIAIFFSNLMSAVSPAD